MLELFDIQSFVFQAFGKSFRGWYAFLQFDNDQMEKNLDWLKSQLAYVAGVDDETKMLDREALEYYLVMGFTHSGLEKLGIGIKGSRPYRKPFSEAFMEGMVERAEILGDKPDSWEWGGKEETEPHLVLAMFANENEFENKKSDFKKAYEQAGFKEVRAVEGYSHKDLREHFGFADGISQPLIEGFHDSIDKNNLCEPGEFVLGYRNERGVYPESALVEHNNESGEFDLGKNGSFMVVRQLEQDAERFRAGNPREVDAAKLIGRWRSGAPLTLCPFNDNIKLKENNSFTYFQHDRYGMKCPIGSHIRRSNPRDNKFSLNDHEDRERTQALNKRHRIIRRGRLYGPEVPKEFYEGANTLDPKKPHESRGTLFICLNASIENQFEFVMQNWINRKDFNGLRNELDPLSTVDEEENRHFTTPGMPKTERRQLQQYVTMRGGAYFFLPGMRALRFIVSGFNPV